MEKNQCTCTLGWFLMENILGPISPHALFWLFLDTLNLMTRESSLMAQETTLSIDLGSHPNDTRQEPTLVASREYPEYVSYGYTFFSKTATKGWLFQNCKTFQFFMIFWIWFYFSPLRKWFIKFFWQSFLPHSLKKWPLLEWEWAQYLANFST